MKKLWLKIKSFFVHDKSKENLYQLDGYVSVIQALPYGLQHVLTMFISNITPVILVLTNKEINTDVELTNTVIQNALFLAGVGTIIQLFPIWKVGSKLPIVMGTSFVFLSACTYIGTIYNYGTVLGATIVGGIIVGILGFFTKYWSKFIPPLTSALVVLVLGISLLKVGITSFGGGAGSSDFGSYQNLIVASITLLIAIIFSVAGRQKFKSIAILAALIGGYIVALYFGLVDFSNLNSAKIIGLPQLTNFTKIEFRLDAIITFTLIYIISTTETIGNASALTMTNFNREATSKEITGGITCNGFMSAISGCFGSFPFTTYSECVGIVNMTGVVNRFTIFIGAFILIIISLFPPLSAILTTIPQAVIGGCMVMIFGSILITGIKMLSKSELNTRNSLIASISVSLSIGLYIMPDLLGQLPDSLIIIKIICECPVAMVFIISMLLYYILPKNLE